MSKPNSYCAYVGPSEIDRKPILVLASGFDKSSANPKTGDMIQTWILKEDLNPFAALKAHQTTTICGGCPLQDNGCYVNVAQAPQSLWHAWQRGNIPLLDQHELADQFAGHAVRLGAYGDPAAVPIAIWDAVLSKAVMHTGYTHQWRGKRFAAHKQYCMASCDTIEDFNDATAAGWNTFRVRPPGDMTLLPGEHQCPASAEAGHLTDCKSCGRCGGLEASSRLKELQLVSIQAHGRSAKLVHDNPRFHAIH